MIKFTNFSTIDQDTCKILLYGAIGPYDEIRASDFVRQLDAAAQNFKKANLHIHCPGGDVMEGLAIRNAILASKMDIEIYVDGIAASMGFVIALCGKKLFMNKYARLMAHSVSGGGYGTAEDMKQIADMIESVQDDIIEIVSSRAGKTTEEVTALWFDGADHWITSEQAAEYKLIDGTYDGLEIAINDKNYDVYNTREIYNQITNILKLNTEPMKWENFFKRAGLKNEATEQEAIDVLEKLEKENADTKAENDKLKLQLAEKEKAEKEKDEAEVLELVENAVTDGRIDAKSKPQFLAILKADKENGKAILNGLPKSKRLLDGLKDGNTNDPEGSEKWTFSDWQAKAGKLLGEMKANDPERYKALYKAQFKKEPVM